MAPGEDSAEAPAMGESSHVAAPTPPLPGGCTLIIPGLPNDVALMVLARLPLALHGSFRCVCRAWKDALQPSALSHLRNTLHISEIWTLFIFRDCVMAYDPLLQRLSSPADTCDTDSSFLALGSVGSQVFFLKKKCHRWELVDPPTADIHCFDTESMQWKSDPVPHWSDPSTTDVIASAIVDGQLCVAAGPYDEGWGRLDVKSRKWEIHESCALAAVSVWQGHLHTSGDSIVQCGEFFDPISGGWMFEPEPWPTLNRAGKVTAFEWAGKVTVFMDTLYTLSDYFYFSGEDLELLCYVSASRHWISLGYVPLEECECSCGERMLAELEGVGRELWLLLNCDKKTCRAKIWSCVPTRGPQHPSWTRVPITSSINFPRGCVEVHGNIHV